MYRIVLNETSYYGAGCRSVIADEVRKRGFSKALLVTDKDLIRFGVAEKIEEVLRNADIPSSSPSAAARRSTRPRQWVS